MTSTSPAPKAPAPPSNPYEDMSFEDLYARLTAISGKGKVRDLSDDELHEMARISQVLRRRSGGPPKAPRRKKGDPVTDNDLLA